MKKGKVYIGDGCYVEFDGFEFVLTTEDGVKVTNRIILEPQVFENFLAFIEAVRRCN